jgi:diketogulonate reductase-like aldo/keto reductase
MLYYCLFMHEKTFQVELNPIWQQKKLIEFCKEQGIHVTAYSPLGGQSRISNINAVLQSEVLKEIAEHRGKSVAQVLSIFSQFILGTVWCVLKSTSLIHAML